MQIYAALGVAALYERKEWAARDKRVANSAIQPGPYNHKSSSLQESLRAFSNLTDFSRTSQNTSKFPEQDCIHVHVF